MHGGFRQPPPVPIVADRKTQQTFNKITLGYLYYRSVSCFDSSDVVNVTTYNLSLVECSLCNHRSIAEGKGGGDRAVQVLLLAVSFSVVTVVPRAARRNQIEPRKSES